jgi:putative phage-type endonuclease
MTLRILEDLEQGSPEWHDQRRGMITASVVGQLVTAKTIKVAENDHSRGVVATLTAERITGYTEPSFMNDDMLRGVMHEAIARDRYAEVNKVTVAEVGFMVLTLPGGAELGFSPDGLIGDDGLLEIKCPRAKTHIRTIATGQVPAHYMAQCQTGLLVSGRKWIDFVSFCAGLPMWTKRVLPDPRWAEAITAAVAAFEAASEALASDYLTAAADLPATERVSDEIGLVF